MLGDRFRGGLVFHTGLVSIELEERVVALPIEKGLARSIDGENR